MNGIGIQTLEMICCENGMCHLEVKVGSSYGFVLLSNNVTLGNK